MHIPADKLFNFICSLSEPSLLLNLKDHSSVRSGDTAKKTGKLNNCVNGQPLRDLLSQH